MEEYSVTQTSLSVNKWKREGGLIAIVGALLLLGVILVGGGLMAMFFFGAIMLLGGYLYSNNTIISNIYGSPVYLPQSDMPMQPRQWVQWDDWDAQPQRNSLQSPQWQHQNVQRRQVDKTIINR